MRYLVFGGDVQSGLNARIEASVYGFGAGMESALIGHWVIPGDPAQPKVWQALDTLLKREFSKPDGTTMKVRAAAIDSGGHYTSEVYAFCNERRARRVWGHQGPVGGEGAAQSGMAAQAVQQTRAGLLRDRRQRGA